MKPTTLSITGAALALLALSPLGVHAKHGHGINCDGSHHCSSHHRWTMHQTPYSNQLTDAIQTLPDSMEIPPGKLIACVHHVCAWVEPADIGYHSPTTSTSTSSIYPDYYSPTSNPYPSPTSTSYPYSDPYSEETSPSSGQQTNFTAGKVKSMANNIAYQHQCSRCGSVAADWPNKSLGKSIWSSGALRFDYVSEASREERCGVTVGLCRGWETAKAEEMGKEESFEQFDEAKKLRKEAYQLRKAAEALDEGETKDRLLAQAQEKEDAAKMMVANMQDEAKNERMKMKARQLREQAAVLRKAAGTFTGEEREGLLMRAETLEEAAEEMEGSGVSAVVKEPQGEGRGRKGSRYDESQDECHGRKEWGYDEPESERGYLEKEYLHDYEY